MADDHAVVRAGLRALLEKQPGFVVVGEAETGGEAGARLVVLQRYRKTGQIDDEKAAAERLSRREREVLALLALGHSSKEIGQKLSLSPKTVDEYRARLKDRLGLTRRPELVRFALRTGLLVEP